MKLSPWFVYIAMQADTLGRAFLVALVLSLAAGLAMFLTVISTRSSDPMMPSYKSLLTLFISTSALLGTIHAFIPSTKTMAAVYILPAVVNNEQVQKLPEEVLEFIRSVLKKNTHNAEVNL